MRIIYLLVLLMIISGCAVKPKYVVQTATGLEVGLNRGTGKEYRLVDRYNRAIGKTKATEKTLTFSLPPYTSPKVCYAVFDDKGEPLFDDNTGIMITSIYDYNQKLRQKNLAQKKQAACVRKQKACSDRLRHADTELNKHELFNGNTCNLPPQRAVPPFPKTICGSKRQCKDLAHDSCMKNLVDAESCAAALLKTNVHSSITSVSCGALVASLNGEKYGIGSGLQDMFTGYLDETTKEKIETGEYGQAAGIIALRLAFTYLRTQSCKDEFFNAAYAPIQNWRWEKNYIEREPYRAQEKCNTLIHKYNSVFKEFNANQSCIDASEKKIQSLSKSIEKAKASTSAPKVCSF
ncbi:MAG: hypothetical protein HUN04_22625 [Desulfobacter sp.]|nr:MAG: hypothetical protein HUN04_22625 [Desulfobacter sp.]